MNKRVSVILYLAVLGCSLGLVHPQEKPIEPRERDIARAMLAEIGNDIRKNYYDSKFHDVDIQARFKEADERIQKATSYNQALGIVAWAMQGLHDSHSFFIPPPRPYRLDYGWIMEMIGDQCYVTAVKPGSDAEKQGLMPGDLIESVNGMTPTRDTLWSLNYVFKLLRPQPGLQVVLRDPDGKQRTLGIAAEVHEGKRIANYGLGDFMDDVREAQTQRWFMRPRSHEVGEDTIIWKLPSFLIDEKGVDEMIGKPKKHKALVLDLRGNPGGYADSIARMVSNFFDHDVKVGDVKSRQTDKPLIAKSRGGNAYTGKLIVLVDSGSASAAEIFSRVVQFEKRGAVIGDKTSGSVMEALVYPHSYNWGTLVTFYAASLSKADIIMMDGKSLEHNGVVPDEMVLPTAADLASLRDPVLTRALMLVGVKLSPEEAGKVFPVEWRKN
jgi:C-terminal processing protease CtpA/Prc